MADGSAYLTSARESPRSATARRLAGVVWTAAGENIGEGGPVADTAAAIAAMAVSSPSPCSTSSRPTTVTGSTS